MRKRTCRWKNVSFGVEGDSRNCPRWTQRFHHFLCWTRRLAAALNGATRAIPLTISRHGTVSSMWDAPGACLRAAETPLSMTECGYEAKSKSSAYRGSQKRTVYLPLATDDAGGLLAMQRFDRQNANRPNGRETRHRPLRCTCCPCPRVGDNRTRMQTVSSNWRRKRI